jgi:23S rRNA (uracil1939-C5)-methyltransferase
MKRRSSPPHTTADRTSPAAAQQSAGIAIEAMAAQGDGVALIGEKRVHIPFTLPGETINALIAGAKGEATAIDSPSPDRISPICKHFGVCGGCSLQHWRDGPYAEWKVGLVKAALAREGVAAPTEPLRSYPLASRRRASFTVRKESRDIRLGFNAARSHDLVDLDECPILLPQIASALPQLRAALADALPNKSEAKLHITAAENGLDCNIEAPRLPASGVARLTEKFLATGITRMAWNSHVVFLAAAPFVLTGGVKVMLPQGPFLQAVEACESDMAAFTVGEGAERPGVRSFRRARSLHLPLREADARYRLRGQCERGRRAQRRSQGRKRDQAREVGAARPLPQSPRPHGVECIFRRHRRSAKGRGGGAVQGVGRFEDRRSHHAILQSGHLRA